MVMAFMDILRDAVNARPRDIAVVELAMPPAAPVSPQLARIVVVAGLAGFVLAAGAASGIELARDPLESVQDVHRSLDLPMLAAIPRYGLTRLGLRQAALRRQPRMPVSLSAPDAPATEAYRTLRTWFQIAYRGARLPTLLVTGPQSGRETVHVAANLGVVLAQAGLKTVLLDADLRRADARRANPRRPALQYTGLYQDRDLSAEPGLSALLAGAGDWHPYVVDTVIPGLHLIPSGFSPPDPLGLLGSPRMASLIRELERHFEVVLIHAPSILAAPDALVLATQVAGTLLVIESGATSRRSATRALTLLQQAETRVLGTVLTRIRARSPESGSYSDLSVADWRSHTQIEAEPSLAWLESDEPVSTGQL
jgi:capsular exopolysaccharide synthesis family protein